MNYHYLFVVGLSSELHWYRYGNLGVQLFFIISGFVIVQSMHGKTIREFLTGRFIRLFPIFWILCTITYAITLVVAEAKNVQFSEYMVTMTMFTDVINELGGGAFRMVDPSYWTLTVELIFYIAIALFVAFFTYDRIRYFLLAWLALSMLAFALHTDQGVWMKLALVRHASYFIFGSSLALIFMRHAKNVYEKWLDYSLLIGSAVYAVATHARAIPAYTVPNPLDYIIISCLLIVFFVSIPLLVYASTSIRNGFTIRILAILGGLTYPLYLLHQTIGNVLINLVTASYSIEWNSVVLWFEILILVAAYIAYVGDKHVRTWLKRKLY